MHQDIHKVEITNPENPFDTSARRVLRLEVWSTDPLGVLEMLERYLSGKPIILPGHAAPAKDPLIDATRPAGTPRSEEQRALEDEAEAIGGVVTHAAGGVPVVVPAGEEPIGIPVEPVPNTPTCVPGVTAAEVPAPSRIPEVQKGDQVSFDRVGDVYVLLDGKPLPGPLQKLLGEAGGHLVVQKVSRRKDCLIALVEGGWAVKLVSNAVGGVSVLEVKPPVVATQPPQRVDAPTGTSQAPQAPQPAAAPAATPAATDPALAAEVAKAMAMLPKLQAADGVRGVMEELLAGGCPREYMFAVCTAIREHVECVKKQPNLKDRVPRLLMIIGQGQ